MSNTIAKPNPNAHVSLAVDTIGCYDRRRNRLMAADRPRRVATTPPAQR